MYSIFHLALFPLSICIYFFNEIGSGWNYYDYYMQKYTHIKNMYINIPLNILYKMEINKEITTITAIN